MRAALGLLLGCASGPVAEPDVEALSEELGGLHEAIYSVWELGLDRDAVHGALAEAFVGEALTRQYVETWATLVRMDEEGTALRILGVERDALELLPGEAASEVRVDLSWRVRGVVSHQGHRHPRIARYRAVYTLVPTPEGLRIADTRMRDLARVRSRVDDLFGEGGSVSDQGFMDPLELLDAGLLDAQPPEGGP